MISNFVSCILKLVLVSGIFSKNSIISPLNVIGPLVGSFRFSFLLRSLIEIAPSTIHPSSSLTIFESLEGISLLNSPIISSSKSSKETKPKKSPCSLTINPFFS